MVAMAIAGRPVWRASDIELRAGGASFTADTLRRLHQQGFAPAELFFVLGADACAEIATWKDYPGIFDLANFAVVSRPGFPVAALPDRLPLVAERVHSGPASPTRPSIFLIDAATADVSSTAIRRRLAAGDSVEAMIPPAVRQHIEQHRLYAPSTAEARVSDTASNTRRSAAAGRLHGEDH
jgi:nicotinate-nucleotide adenylyltransferase